DYDKGAWGKLPSHAVLEVFWINKGQLERIHRFTLKATRFGPAPVAAVFRPSFSGISAVTDARVATTNGLALVEYTATNQYLNRSELERLPNYEAALAHALSVQPPRILTDHSQLLFWAAAGSVTLFFGIFSLVLGRKNTSKP